eukprot:5980203-Alexandrium_andersonii.AAC.1
MRRALGADGPAAAAPLAAAPPAAAGADAHGPALPLPGGLPGGLRYELRMARQDSPCVGRA